MDNFDYAFNYTVGQEGGFTKDPNDAGNWTGGTIGSGQLKGTKFGISAASYPNVDIENLTIDQAKAIYQKDYWTKYNYDKITSQLISSKCFDMTVNMGGTAPYLIQLALKAYTQNNITIDGQIGTETIIALNASNEMNLFFGLEVASGVYYWTLVNKANSKLKIYFNGWIKRAYNKIITTIKGQ